MKLHCPQEGPSCCFLGNSPSPVLPALPFLVQDARWLVMHSTLRLIPILKDSDSRPVSLSDELIPILRGWRC